MAQTRTGVDAVFYDRKHLKEIRSSDLQMGDEGIHEFGYTVYNVKMDRHLHPHDLVFLRFEELKE